MTTKYFEESLKEFICHDCLLTGGDGAVHYSSRPNSLKLAKAKAFPPVCDSTVARKAGGRIHPLVQLALR